MHFVVHAVDKPDGLRRRLAVIDAHRRYLDTAPARHGVEILLSGPLMDDARESMCGSFFLLTAPDRSAVEALFAEDPLQQAGVWKTRSINPVTIRQNNIGSI